MPGAPPVSSVNRFTFETDSYAQTLRVEVISTGEESGQTYVLLSDTVLYPEGGGQPDDKGTLDGVPVVQLTRSVDGIRHYLEAPPGWSVPEAPVTVALDWRRRFDHMQQHSAQHLLTALTHTRFGQATTSFHLGAEECAIELDGPPLPQGDLDELEELAAQAIRDGLSITTAWVSLDEYNQRDDIRTRGLPDHHTGDVRLIEIEGIDLTACGGTHVANTAQLESLKLLGAEAKRGGTRLRWIAGGRLRSRLHGHEARSAALRGTLGVANEELVQATEQRVDQLKEAQKQLKTLEAELAQAMIPALLSSSDPVVSAHFEGKDGGFVRTLAAGFAEQATAQVGFFTAATNGDAFFALSVGSEATAPLDQLGSMVATTLDGRGGGKGQMFQGKAGSLDRRAEALTQLKNSVVG